MAAAAAASAGSAVKVSGGAYSDSVLLPATAYVGYKLKSDGDEDSREGTPTYTTIGPWLIYGNAADFECRYDATGDTPDGSAINTWLALSSDRTWEFSVNGPLKSCSGTVRVRRIGASTDLDSASLSLSAEATN